MSAFPVIERELRVRARRKSTFWLRVIAALLASLTAASTLSLAQYQTWGTWRPGKTLFDSLSALVFVFCLVEGVRQTADCLSQEKRDGTLGLLFLTDLSGFDVVLGKLAAASLGSFYALLAVFPAMAAALPAGGLTAGEFWRTQLVLLNTLFLGLACGMWSTSRHREENRSLLAGLKLTFGLTVLPGVFEFMPPGTRVPSLSPGVVMHLAGDTVYVTQPLRFWLSIASIHLMSWALLALAGRKLSQSWRDDTEEPLNTTDEKTFTKADEGNKGGEHFTGPGQSDAGSVESAQPAAPSFPSVNETPERPKQPIESTWPYVDTGMSHSLAAASADSRPRLEADPAAWLAARSPAHPKLMAVAILVLTLANLSPALLVWAMPAGVGGIYSAIYWASGFVPLLLIAFIASRPFAESRRSGAMELLLATPLSPESIVRGHWQALWRQMHGPINLALILLAVVFVFMMSSALSGIMRSWPAEYQLMQFLQCGQRLLSAIAAAWLGLYLGLRTRAPMMAVGQNLLWVIVVPWVGSALFWLTMRMLAPTVLFGGMPWTFWVAQFGWPILTVGYFWLLIRWSQRQLRSRFRELAAHA